MTMTKKRKMNVRRQFVTLIEMMIVMFLIAMITGVVAYNYTGSLEKGKAFKTEAGIQRLSQILTLAVAENPALLDSIQQNWIEVVGSSALVQNKEALIKDGWGSNYQVSVDTDGAIHITSTKYSDYIQKGRK